MIIFIDMSTVFNEEKQNKQIHELREQEEELLIKSLAETKFNVPYIDLASLVIDNEALRFIVEEDARKFGIAPFKLIGKNLEIAVHSPQSSEVGAFQKTVIGRGYKPTVYMASTRSLDKVWDRYEELSYAETSRVGGLDVSGESLLAIANKIKSIKDIAPTLEEQKKSKGYSISKALEIIMAGAIALDVSDVHIEAEEKQIKIRYRLDGSLYDALFMDLRQSKLMISRIKLLAGMKLTSTATAQDGRFSILVKDIEINIRTSTVPGSYGESIVMRILNPKSIQVKLEDMGIDPALFKIIEREISKPHGFILITGPTGSGKTTTLYAFLRKIYSPELKMMTIEDPIEYHLDGITQTQVETDKNYTFLAGLRAALRQDPDIIMVGEIRDPETAQIAVNAALTGHMVFSTIHTNSATGVIPRLIDLEVAPKILPSALSLSIAQRLVRKLCVNCKKERQLTGEEETELRTILKGIIEEGKNLSAYGLSVDQKISLFDPVGCEKCNFIGYKGRIGVFEAIVTDEAIEKLIVTEPSERDIKKVAVKQGILDMKQDGVVKILNGITTVSEVKSVVDFYAN